MRPSRRVLSVNADAVSAPKTTTLNASLEETDPQLFDIMELEKRRQHRSLVLIPSENFTSKAVLDALGSVMSNKYSEGYPHARYYGGNEYIDMAEDLCRERALTAFKADPAKPTSSQSHVCISWDIFGFHVGCVQSTTGNGNASR